MKINALAPYTFIDGELLDPTKANENLQALLDAEAEASSRRYTRSLVVYRFWTDSTAGYNDGMTAENRTFRFTCPKALVLERAYFAYLGTGTTISINLTEVATGLPPAGVTNPWLTVASGASETTALSVVQVPLAAGVHYQMTITAAGVFQATKAEVVLHLVADRFQGLTGADEYLTPSPIFLTEQSTLAAATFNAHTESGLLPCVSNLGDGFAPGYKPSLFVMPNLTSATAANLRRWDVPLAHSGTRKHRIAGVVAYAVLAAAGAAGQTVVWSVQDAAGATVASFTLDIAGLTFATLSTPSLAISLMSATSTAKSTTASDYRISVATNGATTVLKTYCYLFLE